MYNHILISTDGSEVARKGVDHGLSLAKSLSAKVTVLTVTERFPFPAGSPGAGWVPTRSDFEAYERGQAEHAAHVVAAVKKAADGLGVEAAVLHIPDAQPAEAIVHAAGSEGCSLIVMASHGRRDIGRLLLGSQTAEVLAHSPVPVLVVR